MTLTDVLLITSNSAIAVIAIWQYRKIQALYKCPTFGCLTRQGIDTYWQKQRRHSNLSIIFLDIDYMHELNESYGYAEVDARLRRAFSIVRKDELLGRWYSGDELILLTPSSEAYNAALRLKDALHIEGIQATFGITKAEGEFLSDVVKSASALVQQAKSQNNRGIIIQLQPTEEIEEN